MENGDISNLERYNFLYRAVNANLCLLGGFTAALVLFMLSTPFVVYVLAVIGWVANILYAVYYIRSKLCVTRALDRRHSSTHFMIPTPTTAARSECVEDNRDEI